MTGWSRSALVSNTDMVCRVQVWAKGFRITERSEEYQLIIPNVASSLEPEERRFATVEWGPILRDLYRIEDDVCAKQFFLGLTTNSINFTIVRQSRDRNDRSSVIGFSSTTQINWESSNFTTLVSRSSHLSKRLAQKLAEPLRRAPDHIRHQLKEGTFLPNREFDLSEEPLDDEIDWGPICRQIQRWNGIQGIATPHLAGLGANVLVGTRQEAARADTIAAIIDLASGELERITDDLRLWGPPSTAPIPVPVEPPLPHAAEIIETLREMRDDQRRIHEEQQKHYSLMESFLEFGRRFLEDFINMDKRPKKK